MKKPNYGIDAPKAIKQLILSIVISIIAGIVFYFLIHKNHTYIALIFFFLATLYATVCLIFILFMFNSSLSGKLRMRDKLVDSLQLNGDEKILDIGCGRGLLLIGAAKKLNNNGKAVGLDLWRNEDLANNSKERTLENVELEKVSNRVEIVSGDMTKMDFPDNTFDVIISNMAIHNVPAIYRNKTFQEINRVLKPGGRIAIIDFQYTKDYKKTLINMRWENLNLSGKIFSMFPPVRILTGKKPEHITH